MPKHKHGDGSILPGRRVAEYHIWADMRYRCNNRKAQKWKDYGGRGIRVCKRWSDYRVFLSDVGRRPSDRHSLDRINNNGNYSPSNVRWATAKEQKRNTRENHRLSYDGIELTISEWSERTGLPWSTIYNRLRRGWTVEKTLSISRGEAKRPTGLIYRNRAA